MKASLITLLALITIAAQAGPIVVNAPIDHVFIPAGFDNNDNVEVVVTGHFPNACYARNKVEVKVEEEVIDIRITALSLVHPLETCSQIIVPFKEVITIGNLQAGKYKLVINKNTPWEIKDQMDISIAPTNSVDDHIYAMVDYIEHGFTGGMDGSVKLIGWKISDCLEFDHVEYLSNKKDVLSILPIMKKVSDFCPLKMTPLEIDVKFDPASFSENKILLFSRTSDGKSVNSIVNK